MNDSSKYSGADLSETGTGAGRATSAPMSLRVVVVEDDPKMVNLYRRALERHACTVVAFDSAEDAMPAIQVSFPDVAFVDIGLQGAMSGLDLCRILSKDASVKPFVVMASGLADLDTLRYASECGVHMFLRKPFGVDEIAMAIGQARRARASHE